MNSEFVSAEVETAISVSEEVKGQELDPANIESELAKLELKYRSKPSRDMKLQLLARYVFLAQSLPAVDSGVGIKVRERFQRQFPDHFKYFMDRLKASASSTRWAGCIACKHNLGPGCAKGLRPSKLSSRYLDRDYACSAFEAK